MQYRTIILFLLMFFAAASASAQQQKPPRPVKNPPQYPHIIDLEGKNAPPKTAPQQPAQEPSPAQQQSAVVPSDALVRAVEALAGELRTLVNEVRTLNVRQQTQIEMTRMTRLDLRIDHYERELKPVRERLAALDFEERKLETLMTRESLFAQTAQIGTLNRDETMRQLRASHEYNLRAVREERERLQRYEAELNTALNRVRAAGVETEQRIQQMESELKRGSPPQE